jgi:hypothetical protein
LVETESAAIVRAHAQVQLAQAVRLGERDGHRDHPAADALAPMCRPHREPDLSPVAQAGLLGPDQGENRDQVVPDRALEYESRSADTQAAQECRLHFPREPAFTRAGVEEMGLTRHASRVGEQQVRVGRPRLGDRQDRCSRDREVARQRYH